LGTHRLARSELADSGERTAVAEHVDVGVVGADRIERHASSVDERSGERHPIIRALRTTRHVRVFAYASRGGVRHTDPFVARFCEDLDRGRA
jgi:hypothetical protein